MLLLLAYGLLLSAACQTPANHADGPTSKRALAPVVLQEAKVEATKSGPELTRKPTQQPQVNGSSSKAQPHALWDRIP